MTDQGGEAPAPDGIAGTEPLCRVCALPIPPGAVKCIKCNSYQNWLGRFQLSTTTLSLLVALIATSVSAIAPVRALLTADDSDISVHFLTSKDRGFTVVAINGGTRAGFLSGGVINAGTTREITLDLFGDQLEQIPAGEVKQVNYVLRSVAQGDAVVAPGATTCGGYVRILNFRSNAEVRVPVTMPCENINRALSNTQGMDAVPGGEGDNQAATPDLPAETPVQR